MNFLDVITLITAGFRSNYSYSKPNDNHAYFNNNSNFTESAWASCAKNMFQSRKMSNSTKENKKII